MKSGKYLTVLPSKLAKGERENTRISLDVGGNSFSWIQLVPRYRIDKEGDQISTNSEVYLKVAERVNEYVHTAERDPIPGHFREVNCALESTSWKLSIFQSSVDCLSKEYLLASQLVYINDPETKTNMTIGFRELESYDEEVVEGGYFHEHGDIILNPVQDPLDSNCLWFLESSSPLLGGTIKWKTEQIRLRHLNTGLYLCQVMGEAEDEEGGMGEKYYLTTTDDIESPGTLFSVNELNSHSKFLGNAKAMQFFQHNIYLERGEVLEDSVFSFMMKCTKEKVSAVNLIIHTYQEKSKASDNEEDDTGNEFKNIKEPYDVFSGCSLRRFIRKYYEMTVVPTNDYVNTVWPAAVRGDLEFFQHIMDKSIYFVQGFPISAVNIQLGIDKGDMNLKILRQDLYREQKILEIVLRLIQVLIPVTDRLEKIKANSSNRKKKPASVEEVSMVAMGQLLLTKSFDFVYYCILDNEQNQMYAANFLPVLLAHLNSQHLAGKCVTEMLSKNMELQETKIGTREIQIFVDKLRSSKMNSMYLNLLQACCSCEGEGVDGNQCKVANLIFSNTNDIIINLNADYNRLLVVNWDQDKSLYLTPVPIPGSAIRGESLISKGLPQLSLAWTTNSIDFSPLGLFGKLSVNVEELFSTHIGVGSSKDEIKSSTGSKMMKNKKKQSDDQKKAVANYFIAQLYLGAEMCMDRNYIAFHKLDPFFPYEVLVTLLKLNISTSLKSAAVRLLMCLHIDRDPQASSKIPCLTRTWSDIKKYEEPQLPFVDSGRRYIFGLIQQLISDHVKEMAGNRWDELSRNMLRMLRTLIEFNFYGTNERMRDVIGPLIAAIDRRNVAAENVSVASSFAKPKLKKTLSTLINDDSDSVSTKKMLLDDVSQEEKLDGDYDITMESVRSDRGFSWYSNIGMFCCDIMRHFSFNNAARVLMLDDSGSKESFKNPARYSKAPTYELETMVEAVDILQFAQHVIEDRNISLILRYFYAWENKSDTRRPSELFEQAMIDSSDLSLGIMDFDNVMIDILMFIHTPLVQSTLEVLMAHHSKRGSLLEHIQGVQLLASHKRERQYKMVDQMLQQLEQNAETQELWGQLETDAHFATSKQTKDIIIELTDLCRIRRIMFEFNEDYEPDTEIQDLFRNLGCFEISMKVLGLLDSIEEEDGEELSEQSINTQEVVRLCNSLLYWFFMNNRKNQELGYGELELFLSTLDNEIGSHLVIQSIFSLNETLMKHVPHDHLTEMVDKIVKDGKSHHYLSLFAAIPNVGDKNIAENQFEIVKTLTSPGRLNKVSCFLVPVTHVEYQLKRELMEPFLNINYDVTYDDLPPLLAYHFMFLDVLSGCTVGRMNVTAVEAKVQSVFSFNDILDSILDEGTMLLGKICFTRYLFNAFIEVELVVPGLERSSLMWMLLQSFKPILSSGKALLEKANTLGLSSPDVSRQQIEYLIICIRVVAGFFTAYYDPSAIKDNTVGLGDAHTKLNKTQVNEMMVEYFKHIKDIYDLNISIFSTDIKNTIFSGMEALKKCAGKLIPISLETAYSNGLFTTDILERSKDESESKLISKYNEFLADIVSNEVIKYKADNENVAFISILEKLPFIADPVVSDVRYETLIKKLVSHIRENVKIVNNQKRMDARVTATSRWIIKAFRTMIENKMGMSIYDRDEDGGQAQDIAAAPVVNALNSCGATALCLDLISVGIDESLQLEAIKLGVGLLFKEGGALEVQSIMFNYLSKTNSELFFKQVSLTIQKLQAWHSWNQIIILEEGQDPTPPDEILMIRMLQLMCEGHYLPNQNIMREQPNNPSSYNLLDDFVNYLNCLSRIPCRTSTVSAIRLTALILEVIQGPCEGNQAYFALSTELVEALNRLNRAKVINDCVEEEEIEIKRISIDIFQGLLEGQGDKSMVYDRVLSIVHLDIILSMSKHVESELLELSEEQIILQTECVVLLQMFCNFRPSLYDELGISRKVEDIVGSGTAMIEVIWRGDIHRRFFHVPALCDYLAKSSKDYVVETVDRSNAENKLIDFLARSRDMYREVKHQQLLTELHLSSIFSRTNQDRATWITFFLTVVLNGMFIADYSYRTGDPQLSPLFNDLTTWINVVQTIVAFFTLVLWLVVRTPVIYQSLLADGNNKFQALLYTSIDGMTLYYVIYLILSMLGIFVNNYFVSLLLLDIVVKDSTTRDVLNAVTTPWKAILMGCILMSFCIYIMAFYAVKLSLHILLFYNYCNNIISSGSSVQR